MLFMNVCQGQGFAWGPVRGVPEAFEDAQARARDMVVSVQHATAGEVRLVGPAVKYSRTPASVWGAPPLLGQHTHEVLLEAGLTPAEVLSRLTHTQCGE
jgi:crotonobetainyl-CoA:carnitine CoA-transferase CaiB-like acyl-CoA transferase